MKCTERVPAPTRWLFIVLLFSMLPPLRAQKSAGDCCPEGPSSLNSTDTSPSHLRLVRTVSRQGHGTSNMEGDGCSCNSKSKSSSTKARVIMVCGFVFCLGIFATTTTVFFRGSTRNSTQSSRTADPLPRDDLEGQVEMAKAALLTVGKRDGSVEEGTLCCVCLEPLHRSDERLQRPPNCEHVYHAGCIRSWLDAGHDKAHNPASHASGLNPMPRCLRCPICAISMLPVAKAADDAQRDSMT